MNRNRTLSFAAAPILLAAFALGLLVPSTAQAERYRPISLNWEVAAPGANTDAITDITWGSEFPLRLTIQCDTSTIVNVMVTRGATENALGMNGNTALVAGATYVFDVPGLEAGDTVNVQVETNSALPILSIGEVRTK